MKMLLILLCLLSTQSLAGNTAQGTVSVNVVQMVSIGMSENGKIQYSGSPEPTKVEYCDTYCYVLYAF